MREMRVGSLFSGIGGMELGLERAGMQVVWQCEIDEFCRKVLKKHWPEIHCYEDVRLISLDTVTQLALEKRMSSGESWLTSVIGLDGLTNDQPHPPATHRSQAESRTQAESA